MWYCIVCNVISLTVYSGIAFHSSLYDVIDSVIYNTCVSILAISLMIQLPNALNPSVPYVLSHKYLHKLN